MHYLTAEDFEEAKRLREAGWTFKAIADRFGVSYTTISNHVNGKAEPRAEKKKPFTGRSPYEPADFQEENFSTLPDHVLFRHVRVWDFIG